MKKIIDSKTLFLSEDGDFLTDQAGNNVAQKTNVNGKEVFRPIIAAEGQICLDWGTIAVCIEWADGRKTCLTWGEKPWCVTWKS